MNDRQTAVLSALIDNEPIDCDELAAALEDPDARAALVDFARLRAGVQADADSLTAVLRLPRRTGRLTVGAPGWPAVAALLLAAFLGGWIVPRPRPAEGSQAPPEPVRVERFVPGVDWSN